ncbi:LOW QUALITY PROTEIN: uncharacterized protein Dmoj_GI12584 [Drosophila mojavensis]|uniref:Protein kinase domain-containing protein n=1 Tax=Drosophila mojavensis TaxID=7230 RepID=B4KX91_DROMO|nr:LOW QUALITY PROTEIN: uncharacterized protein Dmoj_GI12584 [Drosophila mojavensis]
MSLMEIHRSNESFWRRGSYMLLLLLLQQQKQQQQQQQQQLQQRRQQQQRATIAGSESQMPGNSAEILSAGDVDVVAEKPTTYRPTGSNRPSIATQSSAQERERKLLNVLAARRTALNRGNFRNRIGTTGRSATSPSAAVESTSKAPSDPRSVCIRNCTKNFTRRTTASCMRQCANFTRMAMAGSGNVNGNGNGNGNNGSVVLRAPNKAALAAGERDTNEILFSDESSHGLFVVAKEQNDTLNHIADGAVKQRGRGKPVPTLEQPQLEEDDEDEEDGELQPYLYFGSKLPPIKPGALTITPAVGDDEHPRVLEISVSPSSSSTTTTSTTTPEPTTESTVKPTVSTRRPLTAVERSRSRYKYHMRERGIAPTAAPPAISRTRYVGSGRPTAGLAESSVEQKSAEVEPVAVRRVVAKPQSASTPLIITVLSAEEETTVGQVVPEVQPEASTTSTSSTSTTSSTTSTTSTTSTSTSTTTTTTTTEPPSTTRRPSTTTTTSSTTTTSTTTTSTAPPTTRSTTTSTTTTTSNPVTTTTAATTTTLSAKHMTIIEEDKERLRALGPSLTQEINIEDQNNLIIFCNSTANCEATPRTTQYAPTTDSSSNSKILRTTVLTSVRSTVNPRTTPSPASPAKAQAGNVFIGVVESSSSSSSSSSVAASDISTTAIAEERDVSLEMRRMNLVTLVLVAVGVVPLVAIVMYMVRNYVVRRRSKVDDVFDVCITDQQPISPVKKVDSKYQLELDEDEVDHQQHQQQQQQQLQQQQQQQQQLQQQRDANHNRYEDKSSLGSEYQEFDRSNIRLKSLLGEGNFGQVWKAEADDLSGHFGATRIVAVKTIRACSAQVSLKDEANIMRKLGSHQNVVTLLGACVESEPHMLIMEYAMRGRLLSLLRAARSATNILPASVPGGRSLAPLSPRTLAGFALDIACGMEYIAGHRIVHRDLAARNVLLDHNGMCKICDFGMSIDLDAERMRKEQEKNAANDILRSNAHKFKFDFGSRYILQHWQQTFGQHGQHGGGCSKDQTSSEKKHHGHDTIGKRHALPIRWMAPESLQFHMFTTETDIWAFGIVLWEIATLGSTPYSHLTGREVIRRVPQGLRPELPKESRHEFYNLMSRCWHKEPHMRPSFAQSRLEITRSLHKWVEDDSAASDYMDVSGFSEDLEHGVVYFNHRISEFECEI